MKEVIFVASSHTDLMEFPEEVRREVGFALYLAQCGDHAPNVTPLLGYGGAHVLEVISDFDSDTFRGVYTTKYGEFVYVLHAFKKKAKSGRATPRADVALIKRRFKAANDHYVEMQKRKALERKNAG